MATRRRLALSFVALALGVPAACTRAPAPAAVATPDAAASAPAPAPPTAPAPEPAASPMPVLLPELFVTLETSRSGVPAAPAGGEPAFTVRTVTLAAVDSRLSIAIDVDEFVVEFMTEHRRAVPPLAVYLDTDNDASTGGASWQSPLAGGYEVEIEVRPGAVFTRPDGGVEVGVGGWPEDGTVTGALVVGNVSRHLEGGSVERLAGGLVIGGLSDEIRAASRIDRRRMTLLVPYGLIGLRPDSHVRVTGRRLASTGGLADQLFAEGLLVIR